MKIKKIIQGIKRIVRKAKQKVIKTYYSRLPKRVMLSVLGLAFAISITTTSVWMWRHFSKPQKEYVFLMSNGETYKDNTPIHSEYWSDLLMAYNTYRYKGISDENIIVFYGDGPNTDFESEDSCYNFHTYWPNLSTIIDYSNSESDMFEGFGKVAYNIEKKDKVTIRCIIGHGGINNSRSGRYYTDYHNDCLDKSAADTYRVSIEHWSDADSTGRRQQTWDYITKSELFDLFNTIKDYKQREIYWLTCHSGAMINGSEQLTGPRTTVITSSAYNKVSYSANINGRWTGEFNRVINGIYNGQYFDGSFIKLYNPNVKAPITPYKLYQQLKYSNHMRSDVVMGGQSPTAMWVSIKEKMIDLPGEVYDTINKAEHEVEQFIIKNWFMFILEIQVAMLFFWFIRRKQQMIKK